MPPSHIDGLDLPVGERAAIPDHDPPARSPLEGRVALATGANKGIGHDIALELGGAGARVAAASRDPKAVDEVAAAIEADGGEAAPVALD